MREVIEHGTLRDAVGGFSYEHFRSWEDLRFAAVALFDDERPIGRAQDVENEGPVRCDGMAAGIARGADSIGNLREFSAFHCSAGDSAGECMVRHLAHDRPGAAKSAIAHSLARRPRRHLSSGMWS